MALETFYIMIATITVIIVMIALLMLSYLIGVILRYELEQRRCKKQDVANSIQKEQKKQ